ncbi:hypothetical protein CRT60_05375 [Azospirillum palustre]|uniref:Response regulatory domain-containing protein n=1 Tax=Azospirillum palustre TaxID=2044885 RepID=A0A2B8BM12_9PROT|nr:response regulator [Azospirillum palustre]PGH58578.1 hypothetical protein CRT60_05375 [Azospirillum palustre]
MRVIEGYGRRSLSTAQSHTASVLIVSENSTAAGNMAEKLGRDGRIRVRAMTSPEVVGEAIKRFKPDVVVTDKWFGRTGVGYQDVVMPFVDRNHDVGLVVLDNSRPAAEKTSNQIELGVCSRADALKGSKLADIVLQAKIR